MKLPVSSDVFLDSKYEEFL